MFSSSDKLKVLYFNATSIRGKLLDFNSHFDACSAKTDFENLSETETWLNNSVFDEEILFISNSSIFRRDRDVSVSEKKDGGGILIAVSSMFPSKRRCDLESAIEILWVEVKINNSRKVFCGTVYIPPDCTGKSSVLTALEESLDKVRGSMRSCDSVLLLGDFNLSDASWSIKTGCNYAVCDNLNSVSRTTGDMLDIFSCSELRQHNVLPTCNGRPLDLVFSNALDTSITVSYTHLTLPTILLV